MLREALSAVDCQLNCDPTHGIDFSAVPKSDRRSGTDGCDFLVLPRVDLRSGGWRRWWCFDFGFELVVNLERMFREFGVITCLLDISYTCFFLKKKIELFLLQYLLFLLDRKSVV